MMIKYGNNNKTESNIELKSEEFQEILGSIPTWILRYGATLIALVMFILLLGSALFKYPDSISTTMTLTGTNPPTALVAKTSGKLKKINVSDKQTVYLGDYLAIIENTTSTEDVQHLKKYAKELSLDIDTFKILSPKNLKLGTIQPAYSNLYTSLFDYHEFKRLQYYTSKIIFMEERIYQHQRYYKNMQRQKEIVNKQFSLNKTQFNRDSILYNKGVISTEELEKSNNQYLQGLLSLENIYSTMQSAEIQITQMKESLLDLEYQYIDKKNTLETQIRNCTSQLLAEIEAWEQNYILSTPINGQVTFTSFWAENQNVISGETIFNIIPYNNGRIIGKSQMPLKGSGKVKKGQRVNIRFSGFPENEYGIVQGVVETISMIPTKDPQGVDYYTVEIKLPQGLRTSYGKELPYLPNMQAQADIITEDISLLARFFMPLRNMWIKIDYN